MTYDIQLLLAGIIALAAGLFAGLYLIKPPKPLSMEDYQRKSAETLQRTEDQCRQIRVDAATRIENLRTRAQQDEERMKEQFKRLENLIASKDEQLKNKTQKNTEIKTILDYESGLVNATKEKVAQLRRDTMTKLASKSGGTVEDMKGLLLQEISRDLELEREDRLRKYEEYLQDDKQSIAKNIITTALQRYSAATSVEKKASVITVTRDDQKARILGPNCQILLLLEQLLEVDIILNDAPNTIIISYYDLVKKHIATETIKKLLKEKFVTPDMVKAKIKEVENETERELVKIGRDTVNKLELQKRNLPPDFMRIIGRLQFRTSYGQNILKHSFEVGTFTMMLGSELGLNMETCKIGGFFHDLGKAIDHEINSPHDVLTKEIMEKYGFSAEEIHAAWTHHDSIPIVTAEAMVVKAGDALSAGRPGARAESIEKYLERIRALESIATSYEGVNKAFAISAGREVRVIVEPHELVDDDLPDLARSIADDIQENVGFPGKIKINVIRRTQSVDYAKK